LIPTLIRSCFEGEKVNFYPIAVHDWISVDDIVDALILFANQGSTGIFELGTGVGRTNHQVLHVIEKISGKKANINLVNGLRSYDNQGWWCRQSRAWKLGWKAHRKFEDTIAEVIEDYKDDPDKYAPKLPSL
jgi:nucleoside-diphosphate-sugar epimerase